MSGLSEAQKFLLLPQEEALAKIEAMTEQEAQAILYDWSWNGRPDQFLPGPTSNPNTEDGSWTSWLLMCGRGFGKTRTGAETVREWVKTSRLVSLVGPTADDARDIMIEGESGILAICPKGERPTYRPSKRRLEWPNGARSLIFTADEPDRLRGKQHMKIWCLTGDALVLMGDGSHKPIAALRVGEMVMTRNGPRRVDAHAMTKPRAKIYKLETLGGRAILATPDHPIWTSERGFVPMASLLPGMSLCVGTVSNGAEESGTATTAATTARSSGYTVKFGRMLTGLFLKAITSTTSTGTRPTTGSKISNCSATPNTAESTLPKSSTLTGPGPWSMPWKRVVATAANAWLALWSVSTAELSSEAAPERLVSSAHRLVLRPSDQGASWASRGHAPDAGSNSSPRSEFRSTAQNDVMPGPLPNDPHPGRREDCPAPNAAPISPAAVAMRGSAAMPALSLSMDTVASVARYPIRSDVWDIAVDGEPEFFANGILVHNCEEIRSWRYAEDAWDQIELGLRLGEHPQAVITSTPRPTKTMKAILADPTTVVTRGSTHENRDNLAVRYLNRMLVKYEGTRLGRQELDAEMLTDNPGALWQREWIDRDRVSKHPDLVRIVVAVDPAVTSNEDSDETGIVVVGMDQQNPPHFYVLGDLTVSESPDGWARVAVVKGYIGFQADKIVGEVNNGGELVEAVIRHVRLQDKPVGQDANYGAVHASRGKAIRAEPISALYEQGRVHHVGSFGLLEDQLCDWDPATDAKSPDRLDALVWGLTELSEGRTAMVINDDALQEI